MAVVSPEAGGGARFRRIERQGFASTACLLAIAILLSALPFSPAVSSPLMVALLACGANALRLWRRIGVEAERCNRAEQAARAEVAARSRLLASVSHEIRTPMNGILGTADLLRGSGLTATQREQVALIHTSSEALLALVNDILDLARVEAGRMRLRPRDFHLRELVTNVLRLLAPQTEERGLALRISLSSRTPDALHGDSVRLRQVLLNLVGNAIRFTREGSVTVRVKAEQPEARSSTLLFEVHDTGVGIRPVDQARLFQPFAQSDSAASWRLGGTGLGLVISKNIVELMGGEIGFESTRGVGSTFWFRLPLVRALGSGPPSWTPLGESGQIVPRRDHGERRILVVDDRAPNRAVAVAMLGALGYTPESVESGEEALALLARQPFDAVLLDSEMPGLDGRETCRRLRRREAGGRRVPVIAITAHTGPEEHAACLDAGMDDCLIKPFETADLAAMLDRWIESEAADGLEERLARLRSLTDGDSGTQVVEAFLHQGENDLATMQRALQHQDAPALAEAAHGLSGSAAVLGARDLAESAAELAVLARRGDLGACAVQLPRMERDYREAADRMRS